jgi:hypothetical protein
MKTAAKTVPARPKVQAPGPGGVPVVGGQAPGKKKEPERNLVDTAKDAAGAAKDVFVKLRDAEASAVHKRLARQLTPWGIGAAVAGSALLGIPMREPVSIVAGGLADAALIAGLYLPQALKLSFAEAMARWAREHPTHTIICGIAAWVWYTAAVILGVGSAPELMAAGLAGLYLLAARWWNVYRLGYPGDDIVQEVKEGIEEIVEQFQDELEEVIGVDDVLDKWKDSVSKPGGVLPGTELFDRKDHPAGAAYRLQIVPGKQTLETVQNVMPLLATALRIPQRNLLVEDRQPTQDDPDPDPSILRFQVITKSPIREIIPLEGPRWRWDKKNLIVDMGPFADGVGQAPWRLFSENSFWGGFVCGAQGSGKSSLIDAMAISFMDTGLVTLCYIDPQDGGSSPGLFECADWVVGSDPAQQDRMLFGLENLCRFRAMENSVRLKVPGFTPSPQRPAFLVIIDECHMVFNAKNAERWGRVARVGRKVGVAILAASQIYGLQTFGGDDALRQSLETANSAILRIGKNQASLIDSTMLDPSKLPQIAGYGVIRATQEYNRSAPFRGPHADDNVRLAMIRAAAANMPRPDALAIGALDNGDGENYIEGAYTNRREILEETNARMEEELRQLEAGGSVFVPKAAPSVSGPMGPELEALTGEYISAPTIHGLDGIKKVIFEGIATGTRDTAGLLDLCKSMGFTSESWFYEALNELQGMQLIKSVKKGIYELGAA